MATGTTRKTKAAKAADRKARTQRVIDYFAARPQEEFNLLKGLLIATHVFEPKGADYGAFIEACEARRQFEALIDCDMIAARMDELNGFAVGRIQREHLRNEQARAAETGLHARSAS